MGKSVDGIIIRKLNLHKGRLLPNQNKILADTKISDIVPSVRICRALQRSDIETIGDLYALKDNDLLKVRNFGEKGIVELGEYLRDLSAPLCMIKKGQ